eukprot:1518704-Alexandrium_andersonii.AAC.1
MGPPPLVADWFPDSRARAIRPSPPQRWPRRKLELVSCGIAPDGAGSRTDSRHASGNKGDPCERA